MLRNLIKYLVLFLVLCNIPGFLLVYFGPVLGSAASYLTSLSLILYYFIAKDKQKPALPFILFTVLFFAISGFNYTGDHIYFLKEFLRFSIVVIGMTEVMHKSSYSDIFYVLLLAGLSIIINALVFPEVNKFYGLVRGRFSGFILNPNTAGIVCLLGMALSYSVKNVFWKYLGQAIFTFAGFLTLSRTFLVVWLILIIIAIINDRKNLMVPIIGILAMTIVLNFTDKNIFASDRFDALSSFVTDGEVKSKTVNKDTRGQTWAYYYDLVLEKPFFGHGFMAFQRFTRTLPGAHNSYIMVFGEGGIIPFLIFIGIYIFLLSKSITYFKKEPSLIYVTVVILLNLMASHTYFFNYQSISLSIFVFLKIRELEGNTGVRVNLT
ncbi:O-antigen ligase family protein [Muricauda sp. 334s03]|uniref:O-antigen ligase family protein n=1 Tax=Flagellimonas yonaguniensis TaxID=3031325 RepID=A0ABT5Y1U9_9FLAO|nr:O-antigen ligase family protein [[Muricauda] yonaguniensis]MDF0717422.1 O-antigen ligase family protein [[Muricauda] yonaguniensis]